jgi:TonB-linked SusC/RagA family outer membrane protein
MQNHRCINGSIIHLMRVGLLSVVLSLSMAGTLCAKPARGQDVLNRKISLVADHEQMKSILKEIAKAAGVKFIYVSPGIHDHLKVTMLANQDNLFVVLNRLLTPYNIHYEVVGNQIVLQPAKLKDGAADSAAASGVSISGVIQKPITGRIADQSGNPLAGVSVTVKGTDKGTSTNEKGEFTIDASDGDKLEISYVGFTSQTIKIKGTSDISVILVKQASSLNEVVVVGYGTQRKVDLTGAVGTVSAAQLEDRPVTNVTNAIQGTMPGVTVVQNNGQPGRDAGTINIRGIGTLNNANPLVVVDGVISPMNDVNADDIESISVLKDAASSAIYGSRAANGVIVITTKKGRNGTSQIQYSAYVGKQKATELPQYAPSWEAAAMYNQALANVGVAPFYSATDIQEYKDGSDPYGHPNTNWLGLFYSGSGVQQNHYLGFSGGNDKTQYLLSLGYFDQDGITPKTDAQRYTVRLNLTSQIKSRLKAYGNIAYTYSPFEEPASSFPSVSAFSQVVRQANRISPTVPYKYANGDYGYIADGSPMAWLESPSINKLNNYQLQGSVGIDWEIINDLHFRPMLGYTLTQNQNKDFVSAIQYYDPATGLPSLYQGPNNVTDHYDNTTYVTLQALLDYTKKWGGHNFKILGGYSQEYTKYYELNGYRQEFLNNDLSDLNAASTDGETSSGYSDELALQSFFGRLNYDYEGKYLFEANLRYDGSSRFDTSNRWGTFPSFSAGWRISQEDFFKPLKRWFSELKLRGSWGQLGNQTLKQITYASANSGYANNNYPYITSVNAGQNYTLGGPTPNIAAGVAPVNGSNPNIKWETTTETNVGIDAAFLNARLNFSADYFVKNTSNILLTIPVSTTYGLGWPVQNAGAVQNKGWEFVADYHGKQGDFTYNIGANAAFIQNKVTSLAGTGPNISGITIQKVGLPINSLWGYQAQGLFQNQQQVTSHAYQGVNTGPGDIIYKDQDGNDTVNQTSDRVYLGSFFPKVTFGFNLGAGWKGIDVSAFFQGTAGVKGYAEGEILGQVGTTVGKPTTALLNSWTQANPNAAFPRLLTSTYLQNDPGTNPSSYWVKNASYLRLKNLQVGYTLPKSITQHIGIQKLRFYYSGQNILTFTKFYKWIDPEAPAGTAGYDYPQVKVNTLGVNVTF